MPLCVLIPAYKPGQPLLDLLDALSPHADRIVVVNDGSGPACSPIFDAARQKPRVHIVDHAVNLGKGAALRTGLNYALSVCGTDAIFVTADADGQHTPPDIRAVAEAAAANPGALILGARRFEGPVPFRSRIGNVLTRHILRAVVGCRLTDTQTGLRAIPAALIPKLLKLPSSGYEFELDMLILCRYAGVPIREVPIATVYIDGNKSSHFHPLRDSMRIYFVLLRFALASLLTACLDYTVFGAAIALQATVPQAQIIARALALLFNYAALRRAVFYSDQRHASVFPRYVLVVALSGLVSFALLRLLMDRVGLGLFTAKLLAEIIVFPANFAVIREFIFRTQPRSHAP